jgi:hypothetical protein
MSSLTVSLKHIYLLIKCSGDIQVAALNQLLDKLEAHIEQVLSYLKTTFEVFLRDNPIPFPDFIEENLRRFIESGKKIAVELSNINEYSISVFELLTKILLAIHNRNTYRTGKGRHSL